MARAYNFSAGPAMLPTEVLQRAQEELLEWRDGMSAMELSHRGGLFAEIASQAEADLRQLLDVPQHYRVLFLQGGATHQFSMVPMNFLGTAPSANYFDTGHWSNKAIEEARRFTKVHLVAASADAGYRRIPHPSTWQFDPEAAYCHFTSNETVHGLQFASWPSGHDQRWICDMSSDILSRRVDVRDYALIYAGAQKNIGPAGLTIVILDEQMLGTPRRGTPGSMCYRNQIEQASRYNTPPTYSWYLAGLVFQWLLERGGVSAMEEDNRIKAKRLYDVIDQSDFYVNEVEPSYRSKMNVPFQLARPEAVDQFVEQAWAAGLTQLRGHQALGGIRASIYNAMPLAGVEALCSFMQEFERRAA